MDFKKDFIKFLKTYGRLPIASIRETLDICNEAEKKIKEAEALAKDA